MHHKKHYIITGDIGGTNSRLSLYDVKSTCNDDKPLVVKFYRNAEILPTKKDKNDPTIFENNVLRAFIKYCWDEQTDVKLSELSSCDIIMCMATAGVVHNDRVNMTNLGNLLIDGKSVEKRDNDPYLKHIVRCKIINDFVAQGYGCLTLQQDEVRQLYGPENTQLKDLVHGVKVCVGAGTGLGECFLTENGSDDNDATNYTCFPSEGGHVEYAPRNDLENEMWRFLSDRFAGTGRISVERIVSGKGLANVYEFLSHKYPEDIDHDVHNKFLKAGDEQGRVVAENAKAGTLFQKAMSIMMGAYGCEVGSAAIKWIPVGGLFVTGGLTPKNIDLIEGHNSEFMLAYKNKGRVSTLLERVPVFAVMTEDLGLRGVHKAALVSYEHFCNQKGITVHAKKSDAGKLLQDNVWTAIGLSAIAGLVAGVALHVSRRP